MANTTESYALITGATSGIGLELARLFAQKGHNMIIVARYEDELEAVCVELEAKYNVAVIPIAADLFEPEAPRELYNEVKDKGLTVNILVNDAGQGEYGFFAETDIRRELDVIQLNVVSLVYLTKLFLRDMLANNDGKILNVSSIVGGSIPAPLLAVYAATKAFVYSFSQSVINELQGTNVTMTTLLPGSTDTDFFYKAGMENTKEFVEQPLADPADVARDGYKALMSGDVKVISGLRNKFLVAMSALLGESAAAQTVRENHLKNVDGSEGKQEQSAPGSTIDLRSSDSIRKAAGSKLQPQGRNTTGDDVNARTSGRQFSSSSFDDKDNPDR